MLQILKKIVCMTLISLFINGLAFGSQVNHYQPKIKAPNLDSEAEYEDPADLDLLKELFKPKYKKQKKGKSGPLHQIAGTGAPTSPCGPTEQYVNTDDDDSLWHVGKYRDGLLLTALDGPNVGTQLLINFEDEDIIVNRLVEFENDIDASHGPTLKHQYNDCEVITTKKYQVIIPYVESL